jgi:hypothetical protein
MLAVFNRARAVLSDADDDDTIPLLTKQGRIANPPPALTQGPLRRMLRRAVDGDLSVRDTLGLNDTELEDAKQLLTEDDDLLDTVLTEPVGDDERLVRYDPKRKAAVLNEAHPFVSNYIDTKGVGEPMRLLALTELLTEAYMLDEDIAPDVVHRVMSRRDAFLRGLVKRYPRSALIVARHLRDSSNQDKELEDAVADALELIGFFVQRVSGTGDTDGIAVARLGHRTQGSETYALTYDAKSSGAKAASKILEGTDGEAEPASKRGTPRQPRISASTAKTSILRVHRERAREKHGLKVDPAFTLLVAPGFQGDGLDDSLIERVCHNDTITPITVEDFARLVELFPLRRVSPLTMRQLFADCRTPEQSRDFVNAVEREEQPPVPPVREIIDALVKHSDRKMAVTVDSIAGSLFEQLGERLDLTEDEWTAIVRGLAALAPKSVFYDGRLVALNATPDVVLRELHDTLGEYPSGLADDLIAALPDPVQSPEGVA